MMGLSERSIERSHRLISMQLSKGMHSYAPRLSLVGRMPEIQNRIAAEPRFCEQLAHHAADVSHTLRTAEILAISRHPNCMAILVANALPGRSCDHLPIIRDIVYRLDTHVQYFDFEVVVAPPAPPRRFPVASAVADVGLGSAAGPLCFSSFANLESMFFDQFSRVV